MEFVIKEPRVDVGDGGPCRLLRFQDEIGNAVVIPIPNEEWHIFVDLVSTVDAVSGLVVAPAAALGDLNGHRG